MQIAGRTIGPDEPPYIVCDMSLNHLGSLDRALDIIDAAKWAGCDAVKPQLYTPDELCKPGTIAGPGPWEGQDLYEIYTKYQTPREWFPTMMAHARDAGITLFSSVFSLDGVDFLESIGCPAYKIAANEYNWKPLIDKCVATGKPVMVSVPQMNGDWADHKLIPLLNVPGYPLAMDDANMGELNECFDEVYGLSSHLMDRRGMVMAVALGCSIIEAHITMDVLYGGPDVSFSWEPEEFKLMVDDCNAAWRAMRPKELRLPGYRRGESGLREVHNA